jgi:cytochrome c biogenesis protein CcmG/thiol:disulfide interchange protein DsbE
MRVRWIAACVGVVAIALVAVLATRKSAESYQAKSPLLGHPAPSIDGASITTGQPVSLAAQRGHFVLVNFVASWCVACAQEHDDLIAFSQRHQAAGDAQVLGVAFDDRAPDLRRFFQEKGGDWPVVDDPDGKVALDFGVRGPPESFLIDPNGFVISKIVGRVSADGLDRLVRTAKTQEPAP